jgi:hypothetical protein
MEKINGRLEINISGIVSDINKDTSVSYIIIDGEKVYIHSTSNKLLSKIKSGEYTSLECYITNGKVFATGVK